MTLLSAAVAPVLCGFNILGPKGSYVYSSLRAPLPPWLGDREAVPLVTCDYVETLKTPQLEALLYVKGVTWAPKASKVPEKRATVWWVLLDNYDIDAALVNDTLWAVALRMIANWRVGDLEELWAQLKVAKMGEPLGAKHGDQSTTAAEMLLHDKDMDECPLAK